ncbi:DUF6153 family protein [Streptomyces sp. NPDC002577]
MRMRTAGSGGIAVRWSYGVFLTLCVALAVLVHHETSATAVSSMPGSAHAAHAMPDEAWKTASQFVSRAPTHSIDAGGCAAPGMQHCATASIDAVQLAMPSQSEFDPLADLYQAVGGRTPAAAIGRAPPDLSVLSQLRI